MPHRWLVTSALLITAAALGTAATLAADDDPQRTRDGLLALYDFAGADGPIVRDRSGNAEPIHLRIETPGAVRREAGALHIERDALIRSDQPARRITRAIRESGQMTVEAWVRPDNTRQEGPARIVSLSSNTTNRNFTLGQEADRYDFRLRSSGTGANGTPSLAAPAKSVDTKLTHIVYTRQRDGRTRIYIDNRVVANGRAAGSLDGWDDGYRLALANELTRDRSWRGSVHLVAIYGRALSDDEVSRHFALRSSALTPPPAPPRPTEADLAHFDQKVAPLLARHCLECHGWDSRKARLDLRTRKTALAGGKTGPAIVPGFPDRSLLFESVTHDEMPDGAPPLSARDKRTLEQWIARGAAWSDKPIARPAATARAGGRWVQRLTVPEYIATVRYAVGVDVTDRAVELLPRDVRADGFTNTAYNLTVDLGHVEAYAALAQTIVQRTDVARYAARFTESRALDDANMRRLIATMGAHLYRGPLAEHEVVALLAIPRAVAEADGGFDEAVAYLLEGMLQSPRFLYRMERQREPGQPIGPYELANRMSYIVWGAPPDIALMRAAASGQLAKADGIRRQLVRMLDDPRAVARSKRFVSEWLNLARLEHIEPDRRRFPLFNDRLAADMRAETLAFFEHVVWKQQRPLTDLLNAQVTFLTGPLARHYGIEPAGHGLARYDVSKIDSRGGLLTQGAVLTLGGDDASMVTRGLFVMHDLLDGHIDDPPPGTDTTPVPAKPGLSNRGVALQRIADKSCGSCHGKFEPYAFALERYDGLGAYRATDEHGNKLRDDGVVEIPGALAPVKFSSSGELMDLLASSERVGRTLTAKVVQFSLGRPLGDGDDEAVDRIHAAARRSGGTWPATIEAILTSDLIRKAPDKPKEAKP